MSSNLIQMIWDSFLETIIMVAISGGIGALAGIPLGILLFVTDRKSFLPMPGFNAVLGTVINALRSVPFIILLVRQVFDLLRKHPFFAPKIDALERRAHLKGRLVRK